MKHHVMRNHVMGNHVRWGTTVLYIHIFNSQWIIFELLNLTSTWLFDTRSDPYSTNLILVHSLENSSYTAYYVCRWRCNGLYFGLFCFSLCMHGVSSTLIYYYGQENPYTILFSFFISCNFTFALMNLFLSLLYVQKNLQKVQFEILEVQEPWNKKKSYFLT